GRRPPSSTPNTTRTLGLCRPTSARPLPGPLPARRRLELEAGSGARAAAGHLGRHPLDLLAGEAAVAAQGDDVGHAALVGPAVHRLGRHVQHAGDLPGRQIVGWGLGHARPLPFSSSPTTAGWPAISPSPFQASRSARLPPTGLA